MNISSFEKIKNLPITLPIVNYPDAKLQEISKPVLNTISDSESLQELLDAMVMTLEAQDALGLSAIQVGVPLRVFVARTPEGVIKVINPNLTPHGEITWEREGCLSIPGLYPKVSRYQKVTLEYFDEKGKPQVYEAVDYWARIIQH